MWHLFSFCYCCCWGWITDFSLKDRVGLTASAPLILRINTSPSKGNSAVLDGGVPLSGHLIQTRRNGGDPAQQCATVSVERTSPWYTIAIYSREWSFGKVLNLSRYELQFWCDETHQSDWKPLMRLQLFKQITSQVVFLCVLVPEVYWEHVGPNRKLNQQPSERWQSTEMVLKSEILGKERTTQNIFPSVVVANSGNCFANQLVLAPCVGHLLTGGQQSMDGVFR